MSKKHSPMPWTAKHETYDGWGGDETHMFVRDANGENVLNCVHKEDGYLISAAPDLLHAVEKIIPEWIAKETHPIKDEFLKDDEIIWIRFSVGELRELEKMVKKANGKI